MFLADHTFEQSPWYKEEGSPFGRILPPPGVVEHGSGLAGLAGFISIILKFLIVAGGVFALLNIIFAGYAFMSAGGDPKAIEKAWAKIWQSLVGLLLVAGSFVLAAVFGQLLFGDPGAIINLRIFGPGT